MDKLSSLEILKNLRALDRAVDSSMICSITDINGIIIYANELFCSTTKFTREELIGKDHNILNSGFHPPEFFIEMWNSLRSGKIWHGEIRNRAKDGSFFWVDTMIIPVVDHSGSIARFLFLRQLINDKKQMEMEREQYLRSLEDMITMISHRVRAPISTIKGLVSDYLKNMHQLSPKEQEKIFSYLKNASDDLEQFTQELMNVLHEQLREKKTGY
ncbi:MAG: PAS domain-containing protein [Bacteroidetes bacterium]|nr:PAS domain-containing protein [Bacteroidota bacterium]